MVCWFSSIKLLTVIEKKILVAPHDVLRASLASYQVFGFGSVRFVCVFMVDTECYVEHLEILKNN